MSLTKPELDTVIQALTEYEGRMRRLADTVVDPMAAGAWRQRADLANAARAKLEKAREVKTS